MNHLREAVARAIALASYLRTGWTAADVTDDVVEAYRAEADAAIAAVLEALGEPSAGMLRRIVRGVEDHVSDWATDDSWMAAREIYGDMLAAFREENT